MYIPRDSEFGPALAKLWNFRGFEPLKRHIKGRTKTENAQQYGKGKGKAIPLQASTGPEGSRRLSLPDFKTIGT
jgi:hypothetical protein